MAEIPLQDMIDALPPELQGEVRDFVAFLFARQAKKHKSSRRGIGTARMRFEWQGALKDMRGQYTSVELQHRISEM